MSSELLYSEIFEKFETLSTRAEKIEYLRKVANKPFIEFLTGAFNPNVQFDVDIPNYRQSFDPAGLSMTYLDSEMQRLYRFVVGHPRRAENLSAKKKTELLLVVLESLHKDEAKLLVDLLTKKVKVKGLTPKLVHEAFPEIYVGDLED
jgi:hypothetical protein